MTMMMTTRVRGLMRSPRSRFVCPDHVAYMAYHTCRAILYLCVRDGSRGEWRQRWESGACMPRIVSRARATGRRAAARCLLARVYCMGGRSMCARAGVHVCAGMCFGGVSRGAEATGLSEARWPAARRGRRADAPNAPRCRRMRRSLSGTTAHRGATRVLHACVFFAALQISIVESLCIGRALSAGLRRRDVGAYNGSVQYGPRGRCRVSSISSPSAS